MASTNHTPNLNLNQWAENDPVIREDFNADNAKIDAAVAAKCEVVFGTYTGNGEQTRTISFGFTPSIVFLATKRGMHPDTGTYGGIIATGRPLYSGSERASALIVEGGIQIHYYNSERVYTNVNNTLYYYVAFR